MGKGIILSVVSFTVGCVLASLAIADSKKNDKFDKVVDLVVERVYN